MNRSTRTSSPGSRPACRTSPATSTTRRRSSACKRRHRRRQDARVLPRGAAVPVRHRRARPRRRRRHRQRPHRHREAVRPRPGVGQGAGRRAPRVRRRVAAVPHRSLPREDGTHRDPVPAVRQLGARADLEPPPHPVRPDHDGRERRRRRSRPLLRPGRRAARRRRQPPHADRRGDGDGGPDRSRRLGAEGRPDGGVPQHQGRRPGPLRPRPVRGLPRHRRREARVDHRDVHRPARSTSTRGAGPACRSSCAPASTCR